MTIRANWIGAPEFFNLNQACCAITDAYGHRLYLVGSALAKRDYRDVDLRLILDDDEFDQMFHKMPGAHWLDPRWALLCASISDWLSARTGLKIGFQFQRSSEANEKYSTREHPRHAVGLFLSQPTEASGA